MEKRKYYVSVQSRTIMENQGDASYELVINAIPEEINELVELFKYQADVDEVTIIRTNIPAIPYHHDNINDDSDWSLKEIYKTLYTLGTMETKEHILSMGILNDDQPFFK
jgi:hypothetical protein